MSKTTTPERELRSVVLPVERRAAADGTVTVAGYAAVFGEWADIGGWFLETIARGAFTNTLRTGDARAYLGHDRNRILGRVSAGTLRLKEDDRGLAVEIDLPDTNDGRDLQTQIARGDIDGMSFGFRVLRQEWDETAQPERRTILEVELHEVSIVSEPAYDGTSIALRSLEEARREKKPAHPAHKRIAERRALTEQVARGIR